MNDHTGINSGTLKAIYPFNLLDDQAIADCLETCEYLECAPGTRVFSPGEKAAHVYFILNGSVKVTGDRKNAVIGNAAFVQGDHFGEEAIRPGTLRKTGAECTAQTSLLVLKSRDVIDLMNKHLPLKNAFKMMEHSWRMAADLVLPWLVAGERVQLISRRHTIIPFLRLVLINTVGITAFAFLLFAAFSSKDFSQLLMILAFLVLLAGIMVSIWAAVEWANDYFIISNLRVIAQRQLYGFFDSRQESPLSAILSTGFDTSLMGRLIGYGTVNLRSYTGEISFKKLPFPQTIFEFLEIQRETSNKEKRSDERKHIEETLSNRMKGVVNEGNVPQRATTTSPTAVMYQSGSFLDWMARFYQLRQVKGNAVIYRTHWWILLKKTGIPFLLLIMLFGGFIGRMSGLFSTIPETPFYAATLVMTLVSSLWWLYQYFDWYNDQYILTKDQLMDVSRKPLGYEDRRSAPVKNIQSVEFKRKGLIGLLLNYGTVRIQIGNEELTFDDVYAPSQIQAEVYLQLKKYQDEQRREEGQRMADWITTYDHIKQNGSTEMEQHE